MAPLVGFLVLLLAGCANVPLARQGEQSQAGALQPRASVPQSGVAAAPAVAGTAPAMGSIGKGARAAGPASAETIAHDRARATSASPVPKRNGVGTDLAKQRAAPPFDLTSLKKRLKETTAIGVLAKVALKNQVDDLLSQFRAFHQGQLEPTLAELRRPYDLLVLKVLSLLQDNDPSLAAAIVASRETIWRILSDPAKFATI